MTAFLSLPLFMLRARRWVIFVIVPAMLVGLFSYLYVAREPKMYQTSTTMFVQQASDSSSIPGSTDIYTSEALIPTYARMLQLPVMAGEINKAVSKIYPGYQIQGHNLTVGNSSAAASQASTLTLDVSVTDSIPARAKIAADAAATALIQKVVEIQKSRFKGGEQAIQRQMRDTENSIQLVSGRINNYHGPPSGMNGLKAQLSAYQSIYQTLLNSEQQFNVGKDTALKGIRIFSPANVPSAPYAPRPSHSALIAMFIALLVCAVLLYLHDYFDDSIRTPDDVTDVTGARILGTVLRVNPNTLNRKGVDSSKTSVLGDAYRVIRTNLQSIPGEPAMRTLLVTSAAPSEGKSTTATNLARVLASGGQRVTLVDADLRRPSLHRLFSLTRDKGLVDLVNGMDEDEVSVLPENNLRLIPSGHVSQAPADVLNSARMRRMVPELQESSDIVIIDSPPVLAVADAAILSRMVDGVVLVVDPAKSSRRDLLRAREAVEAVGGTIAGVVVNRLSRVNSPYYYYYYEYHYGYSYGGYDDAKGGKGRTASGRPSVKSMSTKRARAMINRVRRRSVA